MLKLKNKDFLSIKDLSSEEIYRILDFAMELKRQKCDNIEHHYLKGKTLAMIFEKPSSRTRLSFEAGMYQLGGHALNISSTEIIMGKRESVKDIARVFSRYVDGVMIRTFSHEMVEELAQNSSVPIINGLTDLFHPCQALSDLLTILEKKGTLKGLKIAYIGDGNNVANSLMFSAAKTGMRFSIASPEGYEPKESIIQMTKDILQGKEDGIEITNDPNIAVQDADIIYTDVWASMGQETEKEERQKVFADYQVNAELLSKAKPDAIVMHCLPAHRGEEITEEVIEGPHSVVFDQAENRLHAQKAVMVMLINGSK